MTAIHNFIEWLFGLGWWLALATYVFYFAFLAVMALRNRWSNLYTVTKVIVIPGVLVAVLFDILFNWTVATVLFLDLPREATFSQRLGRYIPRSDWRGSLARWICSRLLDPFEIGGHCSGS
ncbi:hypothetical protein DLREEDagrD3_20470 [Denitratisoma sp. agr-D3]